MKKIINAPEQYTEDMLRGIYAAYPDMVRYAGNDLRCYCTARKKQGKVAPGICPCSLVMWVRTCWMDAAWEACSNPPARSRYIMWQNRWRQELVSCSFMGTIPGIS